MKTRIDAFCIMAILILLLSLIHFIVSANIVIEPRKISSITVSDDNSFARLTGIVASPPVINIENEKIKSIYFRLDDGSGKASIRIYSPLAEKAYKNKIVPSLGDYVDVAGILSVTEKAVSLTVYNLSDMRYKPQKISNINIREVKNYRELSAISVYGKVVEINAYSFGYKIILADVYSSETVNITIFNNYEIPSVLDFSHSEVRVCGAIRYYKDIPEIVVRVFDGIFIEKRLDYVNISTLQNISLYSYVEALGTVEYIISSNGYQVFILNLGKERINVFVESGANAERVWMGSKVRVRGIIVVYEGEFEIKVREFSADTVEVIK